MPQSHQDELFEKLKSLADDIYVKLISIATVRKLTNEEVYILSNLADALS